MKRLHIWAFYSVAGAIAGYIILHPYSMLVYFLTGANQLPNSLPGWNEFSTHTFMPFRPVMLPMAIAFASLGGVIGFLVALLVERKKKLDAAMRESEKNRAALDAVKSLMVTLSHYLLNANMIIGGKVRHCRKGISDGDLLAALAVIEEQGRKIDAVIGALGKIVEIKKADYTTDGQISMLDISREVEKILMEADKRKNA